MTEDEIKEFEDNMRKMIIDAYEEMKKHQEEEIKLNNHEKYLTHGEPKILHKYEDGSMLVSSTIEIKEINKQ